MDPLSVTASILGILVASQKVSAYIGMITSKSKRAPEELLELKSAVDTTHSILSQLQSMLLGQAMLNPTRPALVLVDQVIVILTACVKLFSDLNTIMQALDSNFKIAILDRIRWATKTDEVKEYLQKVEMQKNSLNLILTILTCESTFEATAAVGRLEELVTRVLESHEALSQRMLMPGNFSTYSRETATDSSSAVSEEGGNTTIRIFEFQQDLESSRVYSRHRWLDNDAFSVGTRNSTMARWSMMSGLSLSDISSIGVLALPITINEISNGQFYVQASDSQPITVSPGQSTTLQTNTRRVTFIASTEYEIQDWGIKIKLGILGITSQLIACSFMHHNIIWVVPCFGNISYPVDQMTEPLEVQVADKRVPITVQYHKCGNITYVLLDCEEFRSVSKTEQSEYGLGSSMSPRYCSMWNQAIAKIMQRFDFDQYLIYDMRSTLALLYILPRTVPCCFINHEYGPQIWQNLDIAAIATIHHVFSPLADTFQLENNTIRRYFGNVQELDFIFMIATYLRYHQKGRGFVSVGPKITYDESSITHKAVSRARLANIVHLTFPDPSDTGPYDYTEEERLVSDKQRLLGLIEVVEKDRSHNRILLQKWAGLDINPEAELLIFVGRWNFQSGLDLIANVMSSILDAYSATQFVAIGPIADQCGSNAAVKLTTLSNRFPGRVYLKPEFTSCPPFVFSGAEFSLLPMRYNSVGLASIEWGRRGTLGIGSTTGGQGQIPGFWYKATSVVRTNALEHRFKKAIKDALKSSVTERRHMRAACVRARFPVGVWVRELDEILSDCVRHHSRQQQG